MRINLVTPFAEKDEAKALGARWDSTRKVWYVVDIADLGPFMRWIPDIRAASTNAESGLSSPAAHAKAVVTEISKPAVVTKPTKVVPHCGCAVLPWEECIHS